MIAAIYLLTSKWHDVEGELVIILGLVDLAMVSVVVLSLTGGI